jgi:hypothetical protein
LGEALAALIFFKLSLLAATIEAGFAHRGDLRSRADFELPGPRLALRLKADTLQRVHISTGEADTHRAA